MAVNKLSPTAEPEDKVFLHCHKSWQPVLYLLAICIPSDHGNGPECGTHSKSIVTVTVNKSDIPGNRKSSKKLVLGLLVTCILDSMATSNQLVLEPSK